MRIAILKMILERSENIDPSRTLGLEEFSTQELIDVCAIALILLEKNNEPSAPAQESAWAH